MRRIEFSSCPGGVRLEVCRLRFSVMSICAFVGDRLAYRLAVLRQCSPHTRMACRSPTRIPSVTLSKVAYSLLQSISIRCSSIPVKCPSDKTGKIKSCGGNMQLFSCAFEPMFAGVQRVSRVVPKSKVFRNMIQSAVSVLTRLPTFGMVNFPLGGPKRFGR